MNGSSCFPIELNPVSLQLDLNSLFQLDNLVLRFKVLYNTLPDSLCVKHRRLGQQKRKNRIYC